MERLQIKGLTGLMITVIQWPSTGLKTVEPAGELIAENAVNRDVAWGPALKSTALALSHLAYWRDAVTKV